MAGFYELDHKGKKILCLDISSLQVRDKPEFHKFVARAKQIIGQHAPKSALVITNVTDTGFDTEIANLIKEYAEHNTPYVKASSVVGVTGWQKVILTTIKAVTRRDFHLADTEEEAKEWLINQ